jgi:hypothetical protein
VDASLSRGPTARLGRSWLVLALVLIAQFMVVLDATIVTVALAAGNITMFLMVAGLFTMMFFPTLYLAQIKGSSPIKVGLAYLPWPVAMAAAGNVAHRLGKYVGPRIPLAVGLAFVAVGLFTYGRLPAGGSDATDVLPRMILILTAIGAGSYRCRNQPRSDPELGEARCSNLGEVCCALQEEDTFVE